MEFSEHDEAAKAIKTLNDTKLDGRYIYIREVKIYYNKPKFLKEEEFNFLNIQNAFFVYFIHNYIRFEDFKNFFFLG